MLDLLLKKTTDMNHLSKNLEKLFISRSVSANEMLAIIQNAPKSGLPSGILLVLDDMGRLEGTITEGDIRRGILKFGHLDFISADVINTNPIIFDEKISALQILNRLPIELKNRGRSNQKFLGKIVLVNESNEPVRIIDYHELWEQRVATHRHVVVVGLGYVGLTLSLALADAGIQVTGVDADLKKLDLLKKGKSYIHEQGLQRLLTEYLDDKFIPQANIPDSGDVFVISVGTPVEKHPGQASYLPNMDYLQQASKLIGNKLQQGNLVILRSTVPIGTSRNYVIPILEQSSGLKCGLDFHLSFAPERTAEGRAIKELRELPQIIGGYNSDSVEATAALFKELTNSIVRVDSLEASEMIKLLNNSFRDYVFAFSNYVSQLAAEFNINIGDIITAANKGYPRNPIPLPSPGVGGPCLTKDPYIFAEVARSKGLKQGIFEQSREINESMHSFIVDRLLYEINRLGKDPANCSVLACGLAFKGRPETGDLRNSSAVEIVRLLKPHVAEIYGYDPVADMKEIASCDIVPVFIPEGFRQVDIVMFLNNHLSFEKINIFEMVREMNEKPIVFDAWHLFRPDDVLHVRPSVYMGLSFVTSSVSEDKAVSIFSNQKVSTSK